MSLAAASLNERPPRDDAAELVRRAQRGDQRAFAALYREHAAYVAGVAFRLLGDANELDDVVQETFVAAARGLHGLQEAGALRGWLVTIAVRSIHRRLGERRRRGHLRAELAAAAGAARDVHPTPGVRELYDALGRLSPRLRLPWLLVRVEGFALAEAAAHCGISLATTKRRVARAESYVQRRLHAR